MACHTSTELKVRTVLHNLPYFADIVDRLVLIDSSECQKNGLEGLVKSFYPLVDVSIHYVPNDTLFLCHAKFMYYLTSHREEYSQYDRVVLTNDSYLVCQPLTAFGRLKDHDAYDMVGLLASNEVEYHFPDFLRAYRPGVLPTLVRYFMERRHVVESRQSLIMEYEIGSTALFSRRKALFEAEDGYLGNIHFDSDKMRHYLRYRNYPILKLKTLALMKRNSREWRKHLPTSVRHFMLNYNFVK